MPNYEQTVIIGYAGKDAELKFTQNGKAFCNFSVAVSHSWKQGDEWQESTNWYNVTVWGERAERIADRIKKGCIVQAVGRVEARIWGEPAKASLDLNASFVQVFDKVERGNNDADNDEHDIPW